jgi:hypothetical protein
MQPLWGPYGRAAVALADRVAASGADAIWFHGFDADAFEACERAGLAACVELKTFRADFAARPDLVPIGADGKPIRYGRLVQGVCLARRDFVDAIEESLAAGLDAFAPAGVWLDYLTYAGWFETPEPDLQESCFCGECIAEFCEATGVDAGTPAEILSRHPQAWTDHKCRRIAAFAHRYASVIRTRRPGCIVGAYMCPWTPSEHEGALRRIFAQDYALLAGAIDVFTPLIYGQKSGRPPSWAPEFLAAARGFVPAGARVQPILDALDFPASMEAAAASPVPSYGLQMFGGASLFEDEGKLAAWTRLLARMHGAAA